MDEDREPDHTEDPRKAGTGDGGHPEENPAGEGGGGTPSERDDSGAPDTSSPSEGNAGQATGNPDAAG